MIDWILKNSLQKRGWVLFGACLLVVAGVWSFLNLSIDAVPDITNVQVQINTRVEAFVPEETEKLVTFPIETEMGGLQNLVEMRSLSKTGLSQVTLIFKDGTDVYRARQLVSERLQAVLEDLPIGLQPKLAPITTGLGEIFYYSLDYNEGAANKPASRFEQLLELRRIQDWIIKPELRRTPGVIEVNSIGGYEKQIQVLADPFKLKSSGVSFGELSDVIAENTENAGGGVVELGGEQLSIRSVGRVETIPQIAALPIKFRSEVKPLSVKDVAEVQVGAALRNGAATKNGAETVLSTTMMLAGENSRTVSREVGEKLREIQTRLPAGVTITPEYDRSELVEKTIGTVRNNLFEGGILVVVVLFVFLGNWRAALIVASAIPLSMLFAFMGMARLGISGNLMSLGAIDFGLMVDGAVVITEAVVRGLGLKQKELNRALDFKERLQEVLSASQEVGRPMVFGVAIITLVYLPILALVGIDGKMFRPMAFTVVFALLGALIVSLTLVPTLCALCLSGRVSEGENRLVRKTLSFYEPPLQWAMQRPGWTAAGSLVLFGVALWLFFRMGAEFIPQLNEGSFATHLIRTTSIGLDHSIAMQLKSEKVLLEKFPEIKGVFSRIGTDEAASDPMGVNVSDTYISLKAKADWPEVNGKRRSKEELAQAMQKELEVHVPGQSYIFSQPIQMRFNEILEGTRADITVKVFGDDHGELERLATQIREILEKVPGADEVEFDQLGKAPVLEVVINREAARKYGLHASEINETISAAMGGRSAGYVVEGDKRTSIVVRLSDENRKNLDYIGLIPIRSHEQETLALGQVASVVVTEKVNAISREFGRRRAAIMIKLKHRDVESFVNNAAARIQQEVTLPSGYHVEWGGQFQNLKQAGRRLLVVVPIMLAMIFLLVLLAFKSWKQALMVITGIPLAATGGVFALVLRDIPWSISAAVGFIALSGVAVLNGVVLVSYINQLRERGRTVAEAVREGVLTRFRPVMMTALVASLGFVPMALATGAGAEVQRPLATVVIGGILSATFLTLILLPALYQRFETRAPETPAGR